MRARRFAQSACGAQGADVTCACGFLLGTPRVASHRRTAVSFAPVRDQAPSSAKRLSPHRNRDRGDNHWVLASHTTVHAGPHTAVRRVELDVSSRAFNSTHRQRTIRSLPRCPWELPSAWNPEGQAIGFSAAGGS